MAELGCRTLVWSDGRARLLPVEGEVAGFKDQVLQLLFMLCEVAQAFGMTVLVEPLGTRRTNFLNTLREVGEVVERVGKANLAGVLSLREMESIGLTPSELPAYRELIGHVQMENPGAEPDPRKCPRPGDGFDYRPFLRALKGMGYCGRISLPEDADAAALVYCRQLWSD
jgi:sugar phosphate isomerase/epimerase